MNAFQRFAARLFFGINSTYESANRSPRRAQVPGSAPRDATLDLTPGVRSELVRRLNIVANHVIPEDKAPQQEQSMQQLDLFTDYEAEAARKVEEDAQLNKERKMQQAMLSIRGKFGKNAILRGMNLEEGATTRDRNEQIGGHKA